MLKADRSGVDNGFLLAKAEKAFERNTAGAEDRGLVFGNLFWRGFDFIRQVFDLFGLDVFGKGEFAGRFSAWFFAARVIEQDEGEVINQVQACDPG